MPSVMIEVTPEESLPDSNGWKGRHLRAARVHPVALMISAIDVYVSKYADRYSYMGDLKETLGGKIADDYVLGPAIRDMLVNTRALLNGEIGGLDGGTCDAAILGIFSDAGFEGEL